MRHARAEAESEFEPSDPVAVDGPISFVLRRERPLPDDRLREIVDALHGCVRRVFPGKEITVKVGRDTDWDSSAYHLLVFTVDLGDDFDPDAFVRDEFSVYRFAARLLSTREAWAITLIVQTASFQVR